MDPKHDYSKWQKNIARLARHPKLRLCFTKINETTFINFASIGDHFNLLDFYPGPVPKAETSGERDANLRSIITMLEEIFLQTKTPVLMTYTTGTRWNKGTIFVDATGVFQSPHTELASAMEDFNNICRPIMANPSWVKKLELKGIPSPFPPRTTQTPPAGNFRS